MGKSYRSHNIDTTSTNPFALYNDLNASVPLFAFVYADSYVGSVTIDDASYTSGTAIDLNNNAKVLCFTYDSENACIDLVLDPDTLYTLAGFTVYEWIQTSIADVIPSLNPVATGFTGLHHYAMTTINGAHSRPLSRLVAAGENTFWVAGDWGNDDHGNRDGRIGLAEVGVGHNYGPAQVNFSIGYIGSNQNLTLNGDMKQRGKYAMVEGVIPLPNTPNVYATLGAYGQWGDIDLRRGFDNSGTIEYSSGSTDTTSYGVRARLDWVNAYKVSSTSFNPYTDLSYVKTKVDAFTETGGSFPASYDNQSDNVTDLRIGVNSATPITDSTLNFVANLEAVHRFDSSASATSGSVATLGAFSIDGQKFDQNWLKAGVGVEGSVAEGKFSLMLNGTTEGEMPNTWVAASYQLNF